MVALLGILTHLDNYMKNKNAKQIKSFTKYCEANPSQRFWQALRNWADVPFLYQLTENEELKDTFFLDEPKKK